MCYVLRHLTQFITQRKLSMKLREKLLSTIRAHECVDTFWLTAVAFEDFLVESPEAVLVTGAQLASVHRALSGLAKQELIVRLGRRFRNGRTHWCTPEYAAKHPGGNSDRALAAKIGVSASSIRRARLLVVDP
jgi:hypothetical protein